MENMNIEKLKEIRDEINTLIEGQEKQEKVKSAFEEDLKDSTMTVGEAIGFLDKFSPDTPLFGGSGWVVNLYEDEGIAKEGGKPVKGISIKRLV